MALRLHEYVIQGEVINTSRNSTHGYLILSGAECPVVFELTGDCQPDLRGRHIRFEADPPPGRRTRRQFRELRLAPRQIGPTGHLSAAGWVRTFECSTEEFCRRCELGEPPPTTWKRHLYLNWYSQNGEVTIELAGAKVEYLDGEEWKPLPNPEPMPPDYDRPPRDENEDPPPPPSLEIDIISADGQTQRLRFPSDEDIEQNMLESEATLSEDPLQRALDAQAAAVDRAIRGEAAEDDEDDEDVDGDIEACEIMDDCIENGGGIPLIDIFEDKFELPDPDRLNERQVESVFKIVLSQLAMCGVAFHLCEHFDTREAYRLLLREVFREGTFFRPAAAAGWVQNYMSAEYCPECEAESERKFLEYNEQFEKEQREKAGPENPENLPF